MIFLEAFRGKPFEQSSFGCLDTLRRSSGVTVILLKYAWLFHSEWETNAVDNLNIVAGYLDVQLIFRGTAEVFLMCASVSLSYV